MNDNINSAKGNSDASRNSYKIIRAIGGMFLAIIIVCVLIISRKIDHAPLKIWEYADVFCIFMASFCRLCSLLYAAKLPRISKQFNLISLIFLILAVIGFILNWILMN